MRHLHHGALKILQQITTRLPKCTLDKRDLFKGFTLEKYVKSSFQDQDSRARAILERVHLDARGPFSKFSVVKHRHYVTFADDFSRKCWIYFMKKKDEVYSKFVEFKALAKNETGHKIKSLRSDNGGEYVFDSFKELCVKEGIRSELTAPHNPRQNGVAQRKNRSIVGVEREMVRDQGLPL